MERSCDEIHQANRKMFRLAQDLLEVMSTWWSRL